MKPIPQPITIHQFHYTASAADAVTNQMLFVRRVLQEAGIGGEIYVGENRAPASYHIQAFKPAQMWNSDFVFIHHSHGNPLLKEVLDLEIPKALVYHNITPERFLSHDPYLAKLSALGRRQLPFFRERVFSAFGDSRYNCAELEALGFKDPQVFPLLDLQAVPLSTMSRATKVSSQKTLLFVGKLAPHKNQALLLHTLFYLQKAFPGKYRLALVGRADPVYGEYLRLLARALGVDSHVDFLGAVATDALEQLYQSSTALLCTSLHEGFCVPLVEAMKRDLPVFAMPNTGVRETLASAGIRLATSVPYEIAEVIDTVLEEPEAVTQALESQQKRLSELEVLHSSRRAFELCTSLVQKLRHGHPNAQPSQPEIYL